MDCARAVECVILAFCAHMSRGKMRASKIKSNFFFFQSRQIRKSGRRHARNCSPPPPPEMSFLEVDYRKIPRKYAGLRRNYGGETRYSPRYLGLFNQRRKNSRHGEYGLSVSYNQLSVCMNVHMRILCSFTYGCAWRRAVVDIPGYRTSVGSAGPTFFHSSRNLPSGASSSCSIIFPSDLRYA